MAENRKSTTSGYFYLSRAQLFIVAIAFILASTVFFFLGILIGQSIEERKLLQREEPVVKIPIQDTKASNVVRLRTTNPRSWSVQVTAFQERNDAMQMASELDGEGYSAFVVSGQVKGKTWHRVRVGKYASKEAAMITLEKLRDVERYRNAIITRNN